MFLVFAHYNVLVLLLRKDLCGELLRLGDSQKERIVNEVVFGQKYHVLLQLLHYSVLIISRDQNRLHLVQEIQLLLRVSFDHLRRLGPSLVERALQVVLFSDQVYPTHLEHVVHDCQVEVIN